MRASDFAKSVSMFVAVDNANLSSALVNSGRHYCENVSQLLFTSLRYPTPLSIQPCLFGWGMGEDRMAQMIARL
jgi:hypothetical protein